MIPVPFRRLYVLPIEVGGRTVMLINAPRCWCGKRMSGREALPTSSPWPDINWMCDEHGNEGMAFEYVANDHFATVNAVPVPEPSEGETDE